jgi:membrane protein
VKRELGDTSASADKIGRLGSLKPRDGTFLSFLWELCRFGFLKMYRDQAPEMAAALAYRTIFSLIPILVLSLVIIRAFAPEDGIRYGLQRTMEWTGLSEIRFHQEAPTGQAAPVPVASAPDKAAPAPDFQPGFVGPMMPSAAEEADAALSEKIEEFVNRTVERFLSINFGVIAVGGIIVLIYGALSLMIQIEAAFNLICQASTTRRLLSRLVNYWALLTLGPLGLILGFLVGDQSKKLLTHLPAWFAWLTTPANYAVKVGLTWLILMLAYRLMPNARIRLNAAAIGALIAAVLWEIAKGMLTGFVGYLTNPATGGQMAVYGSLALIPMFLLWVYVTWLIVLFGLEVTYSLQTVSSGLHIKMQRNAEASFFDPSVGVLVVRVIAERFALGKPTTVAEISARTGLTEPASDRVLEHLSNKGLLLRVQLDRKPDIDAYTLGRPVEDINPADVLMAMHDLAGEIPQSAGRVDSDISIIRLIRTSQIEALRTLRLIDAPAGGERRG